MKTEDMSKQKRFWYYLFLLWGLIGLFNLTSAMLMKDTSEAFGGYIGMPLVLLLGGIAPLLVAIILISFSYWWVWLLVAWAIKRSKTKDKGTNQLEKSDK